jgi:excisionase family DNA binding protein
MTGWVSAKEIAEYSGLSIHTVYKHVQAKTIPFGKSGGRLVFDLGAVDSWIPSRGSTGGALLPGEVAAAEGAIKVEKAKQIASDIMAEL